MPASIWGCQQTSNGTISCSCILHNIYNTNILQAAGVQTNCVTSCVNLVMPELDMNLSTRYHRLIVGTQLLAQPCMMTAVVYFTYILQYLSHHSTKWAQSLKADRACPALSLTCISSCLSSHLHLHGCWAEACSAAYGRYKLWLLHINDKDELQVRHSCKINRWPRVQKMILLIIDHYH